MTVRNIRDWYEIKCHGGPLGGARVPDTGDKHYFCDGYGDDSKLCEYCFDAVSGVYRYSRDIEITEGLQKWRQSWRQEAFCDPGSVYHWQPYGMYFPSSCGLHPLNVCGNSGFESVPDSEIFDVCDVCKWAYQRWDAMVSRV